MSPAGTSPNGRVYFFLTWRFFPAPFPAMPKGSGQICQASGPGTKGDLSGVNFEDELIRRFHPEGFDHRLRQGGLVFGSERGFCNHKRIVRVFLVSVK